MVFFTCNHCGESVKKPSVEKHYQQKCRGAAKNISCMDCQTDFHGEDYVAHTKCISEAQKYSGKDYVHKEAKNSGAKKQESWMDIIRNILETSEYNLSAQARSAFQRLQSVDNVPRKKAKFQNFVANCMRMPRNQSEEVWTVLEKELDKIKLARQEETAATRAAQDAAKKEKDEKQQKQQNGTKREAEAAAPHENGSDGPAKKKSKKSKADAVPEVEVVPAPPVNGTAPEQEADVFQWSAVLEKLVSKHAEGISLDKLKKKLLKKYTAKLEAESLTEKQQKKFDKKFAKNLKKCPAVLVQGEVAKPC